MRQKTSHSQNPGHVDKVPDKKVLKQRFKYSRSIFHVIINHHQPKKMSAREKRANELKAKRRAYEKASINEWALRYIDFLEKKKLKKLSNSETRGVFQKMLDDAKVE